MFCFEMFGRFISRCRSVSTIEFRERGSKCVWKMMSCVHAIGRASGVGFLIFDHVRMLLAEGYYLVGDVAHDEQVTNCSCNWKSLASKFELAGN